MPRLLTIDMDMLQSPAIIALVSADLEPPAGGVRDYLYRYLFLVDLASDAGCGGSLVDRHTERPMAARDVSLAWCRGFGEADWWDEFFHLLESLGLVTWLAAEDDPQADGRWCIPEWARTWGRPRSEWPDARRARAGRRRGLKASAQVSGLPVASAELVETVEPIGPGRVSECASIEAASHSSVLADHVADCTEPYRIVPNCTETPDPASITGVLPPAPPCLLPCPPCTPPVPSSCPPPWPPSPPGRHGGSARPSADQAPRAELEEARDFGALSRSSTIPPAEALGKRRAPGGARAAVAPEDRTPPPGVPPEEWPEFEAECLALAGTLRPRTGWTAKGRSELRDLAEWAWPVFGRWRLLELVVEFRDILAEDPGGWKADLSFGLFREVSQFLEAEEAGRSRPVGLALGADAATRRVPPPAAPPPEPPANLVRSQRRAAEERAAAEQRDREAAAAEALLAEFESLPESEQADLLEIAWETMPAVARSLVAEGDRTDSGHPMVRGALLEVLGDRARASPVPA